MRILHLVLIPRYSGAEILVRDLTLRHAAAGHAVGIAALAPAEPSFEPEVARTTAAGATWFIPDRVLARADRLRFIRHAVNRFHPDVVLGHSVTPALYGRAALLPCRRPRFINVLHDANEDDFAAPRFGWPEKLLTYASSAVVAVSPRALTNYQRRIRRHPRLCLIPNGIDLAKFTSALARRKALRNALGLVPEAQLAVQVGRISTIKRQYLSLEALRPLFELHPQLCLWFAGILEDAPFVSDLQTRIARYGLASRVKLLGPRTDIPELLAAADLFLMPSSQEAQGIALLEGLAAGLPTIATDMPVFAWARDLPGVTLLDPTNTPSFTAAAAAFLAAPARYPRALEAVSIDAAANAYLDLCAQVIA